MEVNKEEALRCLHIAQKHRNGSNLPSALKFARKSVSLYSTPEGVAMVTVIEREIESGGSSSTAASTSPPTPNGGGNGSTAKATGVEEHITSARARPGHADKQPEPSKKREYTAKQMEVVKRVKACKHHEYYEILAGMSRRLLIRNPGKELEAHPSREKMHRERREEGIQKGEPVHHTFIWYCLTQQLALALHPDKKSVHPRAVLSDTKPQRRAGSRRGFQK